MSQRPHEHPLRAWRTYTVVGMSCEHCVRAVGDEVSALPGVEDISVDLATGRLDVQGVHGVHLDDAAVAAAVAEAGYELAP